MASDILISGKHLERVPLNLKIRVRSVCSDLTELWLQEGELFSMQILSRDQKVGQTTLKIPVLPYVQVEGCVTVQVELNM